MNIIEATRELIAEFPRISEIGTIHIEFADLAPDSYSLSSAGDELLREDICGNQLRRHTFYFYSVWQSLNDFDRLNNSGALLDLAQYLEKHGRRTEITAEIDGKEYPGEITKITSVNGMLYEIPAGLNGGVRYQLQLIAEYKIYTEE